MSVGISWWVTVGGAKKTLSLPSLRAEYWWIFNVISRRSNPSVVSYGLYF